MLISLEFLIGVRPNKHRRNSHIPESMRPNSPQNSGFANFLPSLFRKTPPLACAGGGAELRKEQLGWQNYYTAKIDNVSREMFFSAKEHATK